MNLRSVGWLSWIALATLVACKPAAHGNCTSNSDCRDGSFCTLEGVCVAPSGTCDPICGGGQLCSFSACVSLKPSLSLQLASGALISPSLSQVTVHVEAAAGIPLHTLVVEALDASQSIVASGSVPAALGDVVVALGNFQSNVAATVSVSSFLTYDLPGGRTESVRSASVQAFLDDVPPQIGPVSLVTAGVTGEDGRTWFPGGSSAPPNGVEIAVPVTDTGSGVASVSLRLAASDVDPSTPLDVLAVTPPPADGKVHFRLPASAVSGREGQMRFTLTALDNAQNASTAPGFILVDDVPPSVSAPHVDYSSAMPPFPKVCGGTAVCGRGSSASAADHLLRDDSATVSFDVTDCGVGIGAMPSATVTSGGATAPVTVSANGKSGTPCAASTNQTHHYSFTLDLSGVAALDQPDATGTSLVHLTAAGSDLVGHSAQGAAPIGATSGDGLALVSLVRWRANLNGVAAGSPALLAGAPSSRKVAVGTVTSPSSSASNLFVVNPDGSSAWNVAVSPGIAGDIAVGPSGNLYAVYPGVSGTCSTSPCGTLNIIVPPNPPSAATVLSCTVSGSTFGAPPAVTSSGTTEIAVVPSTGADGNIYVFEVKNVKCVQDSSASIVTITSAITGVSVTSNTWFFSHGGGFTSVPQNGTGFDGAMAASFSGGGSLAAPSLSSAPTLNAIVVDNKKLHKTEKPLATWQDVNGFNPQSTNSGVPFSPVFDGMNIYADDDQGTVYGWSQSNGTPLLGWPRSPGTPVPVSAPVLLQDGSLLVVTQDGTVARAFKGSNPPLQPLVTLNRFVSPSSPSAPAIDQRTSAWGVAYVGDGAGWLAAVQLPAPPVQASTSVWPRAGRDSCNSRNAGSSCN